MIVRSQQPVNAIMKNDHWLGKPPKRRRRHENVAEGNLNAVSPDRFDFMIRE
jgi:hypothetical protein